MIARVAAVASLAVAIVVVVLVLLGGSAPYTLHADFQDAGGLVTGNDVLMGPGKVGTVKSISLTSNGQAQITMSINSSAGPLHEGTVARIYENSLSGVATRYIVLEPAPSAAPEIPNGGTIGENHTYSFVSLDQVFDSLNPLTLAGLRGVIKGEAASIQGKSAQANKTLKYLAPGLASTSNVTAELDRNEPAFDGLLVQGAQTMQALASRADQLSDLIQQANTTTGAIARQSVALEQALRLLPSTLNRSTNTFAGLDSTLDALDPVVAKSKIAARRLEPFAVSLNNLAKVAIPTVGALSDLIHNPAGTGDLTTLFQRDPEARAARGHRVPEPDPGDERLAGPARQPARVHAGRHRRAHERRPGERLLRRQRPLHPGPADVLRVRDRQLQPARRAVAGRPLPGPGEGHLPLPRWRRPARPRRLLARRRLRLPAQRHAARTVKP